MDVNETVDDFGKPLFEVTSDKFKTTFRVKKEFGGYAFYTIEVSKGHIPEKLSGRYTNHERALADLQSYIRQAKPSKTVKRDANTAAREKQKQDAARAKSDNEEHIQQGASD